jgi:two-component system chemotaxis response regulator CheY
LKILIAEDDFVCSTLMKELLRKYGTCHVASDGQEGVTAFDEALKAGEPFDLVCLDIMMPVMDGQEALREIRKIEQENGVEGSDCAKIIMTTALDDAKNIMDALVLGSAEGYLNKPITPEQLAEELNKFGFKPLKDN